MNSPAVGLITLVVVAVGSAVFWHSRVRRYWDAAARSALTAGVVWSIFGGVVQTATVGYLDSLFLVAFLFATFWAFVIACLVGLGFRGESSNG